VLARAQIVMIAAAWLAAGSAFAEPLNVPVASEVRLGGDAKETRFVLDLSDRIELTAFTLADPYRVVLDLPQVNFNLPPKTGDNGRGLIKAFRYGLVMQGGSRIVIDLKGPSRIEKAFVLPAAEGQPARLVLDLTATDRDTFLRNMTLDRRAPRLAQPAPVAKSDKDDSRPLVVIDPGHGGIDTGTKAAGGEQEKAIVLEFAQTLRDKLEKGGKYRVAMTRGDDSFVALTERVKFARSLKAALFISIHADYLPRREGEAQGATVYTLSDTASDSEAARLAEAENKADVIAGVDLTAESNEVADILIDLAQRETKAFSLQFSRTLLSELKSATRLHKIPNKSAGFMVLRAPDVPSVLLELGYVSTKDDLKQLLSASWRDKTADAMARAVDTFFTPRIAGASAGKGSN
jgi:N-acetylmuramoyl-L-alanine amidase